LFNLINVTNKIDKVQQKSDKILYKEILKDFSVIKTSKYIKKKVKTYKKDQNKQ